MKVITTWAVKPGTLAEAVKRFLAGQGAPGAGVTLVGRWHKVDFSGGFSLYESDDPAALHASASRWADIMDMTTSLVVEDAEAGPHYATMFKQ